MQAYLRKILQNGSFAKMVEILHDSFSALILRTRNILGFQKCLFVSLSLNRKRAETLDLIWLPYYHYQNRDLNSMHLHTPFKDLNVPNVSLQILVNVLSFYKEFISMGGSLRVLKGALMR
jgi:hypothetical protein